MDKQLTKVMEAALSGYCNTTRDIADETGLPVNVVSSYVTMLIDDGVLRRTGRFVPNLNEQGRGPPYACFEPAKSTDDE